MMRAEFDAFAAQMIMFGTATGLSPSIAKVLTYLTICQPAKQTAVEISTGLGISTGSVSEALAMLRHAELVERRRQPGSRKFYYELVPDGWKQATMHRFRMLKVGIEVAEAGLKVEPNNERLRAMHEMYSVFSREFADFEKRFK
jgi:DNA-binding transcriptional regulator GbsR (MarR family)